MSALWENLMAHSGAYIAFCLLYTLAFVFYLVETTLLRKVKGVKLLSTLTLLSALVVQLYWFFHRWAVAGRAPIRTRYESLILYCICVALVYLFIELLHNLRILGVLSTLMCVCILIYATANRDLEIVKLPPALQSLWFVPHVLAYFFGYGALSIAFLLSLMYLVAPQVVVKKQAGWLSEHRGKEVAMNFEEMAYDVTKFGFTFLTWGLILGCFWAKFAWGDYWSWDPKENWALISWLIFLTILHVRYIPGWKGKGTAILTVVGYLAILFTYLGMKYLPTAQSSLHVYQG